MTYKQPLWQTEDVAGGQAALARLDAANVTKFASGASVRACVCVRAGGIPTSVGITPPSLHASGSTAPCECIECQARVSGWPRPVGTLSCMRACVHGCRGMVRFFIGWHGHGSYEGARCVYTRECGVSVVRSKCAAWWCAGVVCAGTVACGMAGKGTRAKKHDAQRPDPRTAHPHRPAPTALACPQLASSSTFQRYGCCTPTAPACRSVGRLAPVPPARSQPLRAFGCACGCGCGLGLAVESNCKPAGPRLLHHVRVRAHNTPPPAAGH